MRIKTDKALRESLFYSSFIRMVIQNFFILALMTTLVFYQYLFWDQWITILNSAIYIVIAVLLLIFTFVSLFFL
jgi:hypothetical protein